MIEKLPALISKAAQALAKATTAGEILEAGRNAKVAYDAAKLAARLTVAKEAHDEILTICHKTMADALMIETQAQCRLADEYDAAQERGEITKHPGPRKQLVPNKNQLFSAAEVGLTRKQVHEARNIRDAEKKKPGAIQKRLNEQLENGKDPTRAEVRRVVNEVIKPKEPKPRTRSPKQSELDDRNAKIIKLFDDGWTVEEISKEFDIVGRQINLILERERIRRGSSAEGVSVVLSMTAQEKLETAIRQAKRKIEAEFDVRLRSEIRKRLEETVLPSYNKTYSECQDIIRSRKGIITKADYRKIIFCLHPDRIANMKDESLSRRFRDAYDLFVKLEKRLLDEKESPSDLPALPRTYDELMRARQDVLNKRRAQKESNRSAVNRRY